MFRLHLADSVLMHTGWASSHSSSDEPRCKNNDGSFCSVDSDGFCSFFFGKSITITIRYSSTTH